MLGGGQAKPTLMLADERIGEPLLSSRRWSEPHHLQLGPLFSGATQQLLGTRWPGQLLLTLALSPGVTSLPSRHPVCRTLSVHEKNPLGIDSPLSHSSVSCSFGSVNVWVETLRPPVWSGGLAWGSGFTCQSLGFSIWKVGTVKCLLKDCYTRRLWERGRRLFNCVLCDFGSCACVTNSEREVWWEGCERLGTGALKGAPRRLHPSRRPFCSGELGGRDGAGLWSCACRSGAEQGLLATGSRAAVTP